MERTRLRSTLRGVALAGLALALALVGSANAAGFPQTVTYQGQALDAAGQPLDGSQDLAFHYFNEAGQELYAEALTSVEVAGGRFVVELGTGKRLGQTKLASLEAVFAANPKVEMEVVIGGQVQEPRLGILPAGHSLKSRLMAAGLAAAQDDREHWKGYDVAGGATAVQSGVLGPKGTRPVELVTEGRVWQRPYTLPVRGPSLSPRVRDLPEITKGPRPSGSQEINLPRHESLFDDQGRRFGTAAPKEDDPLAIPYRAVNAAPTPLFTFEGVSNVNGVLPPDTEATVGPNHYIHVVNLSFAIYNKTGTQLVAPRNINTLWAGFGGPCQTNNSGDPIFLYDRQADRYVLTQFAVTSPNQSVCWAVSQTNDPTGAYYRYEIRAQRFPDYYKVGTWPAANNNAYFFGTNSGFQGQYDVYAMDRANMLIGAAARPAQFFQNFSNLMMPADAEGATPPAANAPGILYTFRDGGEAYFGSPPTDSLDIYNWDIDWTTPANSTLTLVNSITPAQGLAAFNWTVCGFFVSNCLPQPGTTQGIDSASWWPMQRLVYRNFGTHETLVGSWTVDVNATGNRAAPRWFELRNGGGGWSIFQQGTHSPDAIHRWMPSIGIDQAGNIALGYSRGDGSNFPSIYYTVRQPGDPLGTMQTEALMFAGSGSQTSTSSRWGDYSSMELDPADDCTFYFTTEYMPSTSASGWRTRVGAFRIDGCGGPVNNAPVVSISAPANNAQFNVGTSVTFTGSASDTEDGNLTAGLAWSSSINGAIGSGGSFSTSSLSIGTHTITASVTDSGGRPGSASITVRIVDPNSNGPQTAVYNATLGAPQCSIAGSSCDSTTLLVGRGPLGPEPNQPNTVDTCTDGTSGTFRSDESNDRIVVTSTSGGDFTVGGTVRIDATVYAWNTGSSDALDLYYAANANSPTWVFITTLVPPAGGVQTLSASYTLPSGSLQAVRARFRYQGAAASCGTGAYDDHDDLVFAVGGGAANTAPTVAISAPANGSSFAQGASITFTGSANDTQDGNLSANLAWTSSINGAIGTGASFSTSALSAGTHTITASVTDSGGLPGSASISVTVTPPTSTTVTFYSVAAQDGRIWENGETTNVGGGGNSTDNNTTAIRVGDTNVDEQYRSIVSFDTSSIPDGAVITAATLRLVRGTLSGTNPFTTHGSCIADIVTGGFGGSTAFAITDFEAAATATNVATLSNPATNGAASTGTLSAAGRSAINKTGTTQLRIYFTLDDNDDLGFDYIGFYPGENATQANRPQLIVTYQ